MFLVLLVYMAMDILEFMPAHVRDLITHPTPGRRYQWQFTAALTLLHHGVAPAEIESILRVHIGRGEAWPGEMERQIDNAIASFTEGKFTAAQMPAFDATTDDVEKIRDWIAEGRTLEALKESSPISEANRISTKEILFKLFVTSEEPDPLICAGLCTRRCAIHPLSKFSGRFLEESSFVVGSTMHQSGRRTDANTKARRFYIVETDPGMDKSLWTDLLNSGVTSQDICAAVIFHLRDDRGYPLTMAVNAGGKSVHGWFGIAGVPDEKIFIETAMRLGADPRIVKPSQWWRMPNGLRRDKLTETQIIARQPCIYLDK
jgi:hypothetical protein